MYNTILKILPLFVVIISCNNSKNHSYERNDNKEVIPIRVNWIEVQKYYSQSMEIAIHYLDSLKNPETSGLVKKNYFKELRKAFKIAEPFASYINPEVGHKANGPALPIYKDDSGKVITPVGLQKLEETLYENEINEDNLQREVFILKGFLKNLNHGIKERKLTPKRFFIATHQQLMRLVSLSMAGFDTPVSGLSILETQTSLQSLFEIYKMSLQPIIQRKNSGLDLDFSKNIAQSIHFINQNSDFETFDRFTFIRNYLNKITKNWVNIRQTSQLWSPKGNSSPFNFDAVTFFESNSFNVAFFKDKNDQNPSKEIVALGEKLFFDTEFSKNKSMSCATCHIPSKAYADGKKFGLDNNGNPLARNTPTLLNSIYQQGFFWDGRANTLINQIGMVFENKKEFNNPSHEFSDTILKDENYRKLFFDAYKMPLKKNTDIFRAISAYIATLQSFDSKFDKNIRAEENTFTTSEKNGFNLFMGKALCATCHFMPLTNGTVPPFFNETEKEVIGVPETAKNQKLDNDTGFYFMYESPLHKGMFKTPSIRNIALTAPYMHNGVYNTLEQVVDFYVQGGGEGLGFNVPHQTLPFDKLDITEQDKKDLVAFMKTLTDVSENASY